MTKTAEEKREERAEKRRADRVKDVFQAILAATKNPAKGRIPTDEISTVTGYSEGLVTSTIKLINTTLHEYGQAGNYMIRYTPPRNGEGGGWSIATSWAEWVGWHGTLHRHATTRVESLVAFADVMEGLWPKEAQYPGVLGVHYQNARDDLDKASNVMAPRAKPVAPQKARRAVKQHG